tara:strand:+ start:381 stop:602 length:222 start_codon:yes stop_codon:yes gene_type:complete
MAPIRANGQDEYRSELARPISSLSTVAGSSAACVDDSRQRNVAGYVVVAHDKGNRAGCACHEFRDIGKYYTQL